MTLYDYLMLDEPEQYNAIWDQGVFLDNAFEKGKRINLYAIDMFFVEVVYDSKTNKIIENRPFKQGHRIDKYSPKFKSKF